LSEFSWYISTTFIYHHSTTFASRRQLPLLQETFKHHSRACSQDYWKEHTCVWNVHLFSGNWTLQRTCQKVRVGRERRSESPDLLENSFLIFTELESHRYITPTY
jgi:hypothetical protein